MKLARYMVGLISGLTFGMLFAPKKGKALRKEVAKGSDKSNVDALKVLGDALMDAGGEAYREFQKLSDHEQIKALKELSKEKLEALLTHAEDRGFEIGSRVQKKLDHVATLLKEDADKVGKKAKNVTSEAARAVKAKAKGVKRRFKKSAKNISAVKKTTRTQKQSDKKR